MASPEGRDKLTIPRLVSVNTEEPGSSARTIAYLDDHLLTSWGPSISNAITSSVPLLYEFSDRI